MSANMGNDRDVSFNFIGGTAVFNMSDDDVYNNNGNSSLSSVNLELSGNLQVDGHSFTNQITASTGPFIFTGDHGGLVQIKKTLEDASPLINVSSQGTGQVEIKCPSTFENNVHLADGAVTITANSLTSSTPITQNSTIEINSDSEVALNVKKTNQISMLKVDANSNEVVVGTTLQVNGNTHIAGSLYNHNINATGIISAGEEVHSYIHKISDNATGAQWILQNGNYKLNFQKQNIDGTWPNNSYINFTNGDTINTVNLNASGTLTVDGSSVTAGDNETKGDKTIQGNLTVQGTSTLNGSTTVNNTMNVLGAAASDAVCFISGNATGVKDGKLYLTNGNQEGHVIRTTGANGDLLIKSYDSGNGEYINHLLMDRANGNVSIYNNLLVGGAITVLTNAGVGGKLTVMGNTEMKGTLDGVTEVRTPKVTIADFPTAQWRIHNGNFSMNFKRQNNDTSWTGSPGIWFSGTDKINAGAIQVSGTSTLGNTDVTGQFTINGNTITTGGNETQGDKTIGGNLTVAGSSTFNGDTTIQKAGNRSLLKLSGSASGVPANNISEVQLVNGSSDGFTVFNSQGSPSLIVAKLVNGSWDSQAMLIDYTTKAVQITNNASIGGTLGVTGASTLTNTSVNGTLGVTGTSTLSNTNVTGQFTINGNTITTGGNETQGDKSIRGNLTVEGFTELKGEVRMNDLIIASQLMNTNGDKYHPLHKSVIGFIPDQDEAVIFMRAVKQDDMVHLYIPPFGRIDMSWGTLDTYIPQSGGVLTEPFKPFRTEKRYIRLEAIYTSGTFLNYSIFTLHPDGTWDITYNNDMSAMSNNNLLSLRWYGVDLWYGTTNDEQ